ncbi:oxidoreductase, partial [Streptomyces resistomycificus]
MTSLFDSVTFGKIPLANRLVMAPMTRNRAKACGGATELMARYYAQRASAGLIITEGVQPSQVGQGFLNTPGLHHPEQVASWRAVTDAVHAEGGRIVAQLMHAGRIGHPSLYDSAHTSVAPSPVAATGQCFTPGGMQDYPVPHELTADEIAATVADFAAAARNAVEAGFDGVQIHAGNGFLLHQFLAENTNHRT